MVDRAPAAMHLAVDLHVDLVQAPSSVRESPRVADPLSADLRSEHGPKPGSPQPCRVMAGVDAALEHQILDVAQ